MAATQPGVSEVKAYLGTDHSFSDEEISSELESERLAQGHACKVPDEVPADLATALCRRTVRALQMKSKPLGYESGIDGGISYISANDPEIRRLEAPYRKLAIR